MKKNHVADTFDGIRQRRPRRAVKSIGPQGQETYFGGKNVNGSEIRATETPNGTVVHQNRSTGRIRVKSGFVPRTNPLSPVMEMPRNFTRTREVFPWRQQWEFNKPIDATANPIPNVASKPEPRFRFEERKTAQAINPNLRRVSQRDIAAVLKGDHCPKGKDRCLLCKYN